MRYYILFSIVFGLMSVHAGRRALDGASLDTSIHPVSIREGSSVAATRGYQRTYFFTSRRALGGGGPRWGK
jgi:hypothetical protein